jgi:hypothetical protein
MKGQYKQSLVQIYDDESFHEMIRDPPNHIRCIIKIFNIREWILGLQLFIVSPVFGTLVDDIVLI